MNNSQIIPTEIIDQYHRNGYVVVTNAIDPELVRETSRHIDWLQQKHPDLRPENLHHRLVASDPFWVRLISDDRLLDIAEAFIGSNIALFASHYISKPPIEGRPVLWHQDGSYWPLQPMEAVTLWLAVDDSTQENGCMQVIPGTHVTQLQEMKARPDIPSVLGSGMAEELVDTTKAVDVIVKAGGVSVHHPNLIHGSTPNTSSRRRAGLTIRYIPTSTRIVSETTWPCAFLLRGEAEPDINDYQPKPKYVPGHHMPFSGCTDWS